MRGGGGEGELAGEAGIGRQCSESQMETKRGTARGTRKTTGSEHGAGKTPRQGGANAHHPTQNAARTKQ